MSNTIIKLHFFSLYLCVKFSFKNKILIRIYNKKKINIFKLTIFYGCREVSIASLHSTHNHRFPNMKFGFNDYFLKFLFQCFPFVNKS